MQISKGFKFTPVQFESKSFLVSISHDELGLPNPASIEDVRAIANDMSFELEALLAIERVKLGLIHANQIKPELAPWITNSQRSSTTAQD